MAQVVVCLLSKCKALNSNPVLPKISIKNVAFILMNISKDPFIKIQFSLT
jgi:hypothetical protein